MPHFDHNIITEVLNELFASHGFFGMYLGSLFLGENAIIIAFTMGQQNYLDFKQLIPGAFLGSLSADLFWFAVSRFFLSRYKIRQRIEKSQIISGWIYKTVVRDNSIWTFTIIKFLVGLRLVLTIAFVLVKNIRFIDFLGYCLLSNAVFIAALYLLSLMISLGINVLPLYNNIVIVLLASVLAVVIINILQKYVYKLLLKK